MVGLAQALVEDNSWSPTQLRSTMANSMPPLKLATERSFTAARELSIQILAKQISFDCYINDMITVCLMINENMQKAMNAIPLILDSLFRPINSNEPVARNPILRVAKLLAEGGMEETKTILGWIVDTRSLNLNLLSVKLKVLTLKIDSMLEVYKNKKGTAHW